MPDDFQYVKMPDGSYGKFAADASPETMRAAVEQHFPDAYKSAEPSLGDKVVTQLGKYGKGVAQGLTNPFLHPIDTAKGMLESTPPGMIFDAITGRKNAGQQIGEGLVNNPSETLGQLTGGALLGEVGGGLMEVPSALKTFAEPDANVAAMKGLRVPSGSKNANKILGNVDTAKPYLQGAQSLEELQDKIPGAKSEVYKPYQDFVDANRDTALGDSTIGDLFDRDKEITAQLGQIKTDPLAMQQAAQKGLRQADLIDEQKAIRSKLFPAAERSGVNATEINKTYGALKGVENVVRGKNTIAVPDEPQGFGRMRNLNLKEPLKALDQIKPAAKDILNGRFWGGNPVDTGIEDAFKTAGPKPNLGKYKPAPESPLGKVSYPRADSAYSREPIAASEPDEPEMSSSKSRMRVGPDGKVYIEPLALPAPKSQPLLPATAEVSPRVAGTPHGEVFPKLTSSRLKRSDLY